jgi:ABC-2 type transport system permease protein
MSGLVVAFMVCLGACNLYGQDGTAIWLTVVGERRSTVSADVRGRQLAVILLFAPPAVLVSAVGVLVSGQHWAWPVLLAGLPAVLGAASGVAIVMSVVGVAPGVDPRRRVGPNDAGGDLGLQAQVAFWATCLLVTPTAAAVVVAAVSGEAWSWVVTVLAGLLNGALGFWLLGQAAVAYLTGRLPSTFVRIRYGRHDGSAATGVLGWVEQSSQQHEERARRRRLNARRDRSTTSAAPS